MFHEDAISFCRKVLRIRTKLIADGNSKMNQALADRHIGTLNRYLNTYKYDDDVNMAKFWRRHRYAIFELIPGASSPNSKALIERFNDLDGQVNIIIQQNYA